MFAYCLNNPISYADNTGCFPWLVIVLAVCVVAGAIYGATTDRNLAEAINPKTNDTQTNNTPIVSTPRQQTSTSSLPSYKVPPLPIPPEATLTQNTNNNTTTRNTNNTNNTTPSKDPSPQNTSNTLTTHDRITNTIIGATFGLMIGGAAVFLAGAGACVAGYTSVIVPVLGTTGSQAVAWGLLAYDVFPVFIAPFLGMEMEVLEYPS